MSDWQAEFVGSFVLATMGIISWFLNEPSTVRKNVRAWMAATPNNKHRKRHIQIALGLIATTVFALGPLGYTMLESHPCGAWGWWTAAFVCAAYSVWSVTPVSRWMRTAILLLAATVFAIYARQSIYARTELDFFFVNPGIFLVEDHGLWLFQVTGEHTPSSS